MHEHNSLQLKVFNRFLVERAFPCIHTVHSSARKKRVYSTAHSMGDWVVSDVGTEKKLGGKTDVC